MFGGPNIFPIQPGWQAVGEGALWGLSLYGGVCLSSDTGGTVGHTWSTRGTPGPPPHYPDLKLGEARYSREVWGARAPGWML